MNKKIAILFVLLANITILAHGIVPHNHRTENVVNSHHHDIGFGNKHIERSDFHEHKQRVPSDDDYCILKQVVAIPKKTNSPVCNRFDNQHDSLDFNAVLNSSFLIAAPSLCIITDTPCRISFLRSLFVNSRLSLRAPPTV